MTLALSDMRDPGPVPDSGAVASGPRAGRPRRRVFTAEYRAQILAEYDAVEEPGGKGALLRREGLFSSHLVEWRRARDAGVLQARRRERHIARVNRRSDSTWVDARRLARWRGSGSERARHTRHLPGYRRLPLGRL